MTMQMYLYQKIVKNKLKSFSLTELLIVIFIISFLSSIAIYNIKQYDTTNKEKIDKSNFLEILKKDKKYNSSFYCFDSSFDSKKCYWENNKELEEYNNSYVLDIISNNKIDFFTINTDGYMIEKEFKKFVTTEGERKETFIKIFFDNLNINDEVIYKIKDKYYYFHPFFYTKEYNNSEDLINDIYNNEKYPLDISEFY